MTKAKAKSIVINKREDIPNHLRNSILVAQGQIVYKTASGASSAPLGSTIGFAESSDRAGGYICWIE